MDTAARHSLSQTLTTLRRSLGTVVGPMTNDPEMSALDAARVDVIERGTSADASIVVS